jgi:hypothetical protein
MAWNSRGYTISSSSPRRSISSAGVTFYDYDGICMHVKIRCPDKAGYVTKVDTNWSETSTSGRTRATQTSIQNAERICNLDGNCLAWNSFGYYLLAQNTRATVAATGLKFISYETMCTYVKASA